MKSYKDFAKSFALPIQPINTRSEQYKNLESYLGREGETLVVSQRPVPSSENIKLQQEVYIGFGSFFGIGKLDDWKSIWSDLDARIVVPITNEEIETFIKYELNKRESITWEEALDAVSGDRNQLCEMFKLPYVC